MSLRVLAPGFLTSLQDAGRPGFAAMGVGASGAFDTPALRLANALCGNPANACGLEITLIGPRLRFDRDSLIAVTGAPIPFLVDDQPAPMWSPVPIRAGSSIRLGTIRQGCRSYLAIHGGIALPPVLDSRSSDLNTALGPLEGRALQIGDDLPIGRYDRLPMPAGRWSLDASHWFCANPDRPLRLLPGSQRGMLTAASVEALFSRTFTVATDSNRVGLRLSGPTLEWRAPVEMTSEGSVPGVLQLPPSGQPIAFGPEAPVSGGYPRIGQVAMVDLPRLAQARPGDRLGFVPIGFDEALSALQRREQALERLSRAIATRLQNNG